MRLLVKDDQTQFIGVIVREGDHWFNQPQWLSENFKWVNEDWTLDIRGKDQVNYE